MDIICNGGEENDKDPNGGDDDGRHEKGGHTASPPQGDECMQGDCLDERKLRWWKEGREEARTMVVEATATSPTTCTAPRRQRMKQMYT